MKQDLLLFPLLLLHQHLLSPVHQPSGLRLNLLFLTAHLHLPTTPRLHLSHQAPHLHPLHLQTAMERSWRWRWRWMTITTGSLPHLEQRKMQAWGLLYLQAPLAWRYESHQVSSFISLIVDNATCEFRLKEDRCCQHSSYFLSLTQIVESSSTLGKSQKRKAGQLNKAITIGSSPILYTQPAAAATAGKNIPLLNICSNSAN